MKYIEAYLDDGSTINNLELKNDMVVIETSYGDEYEMQLTDMVTARIFERVEPQGLQDLIAYSKQKKLYLATVDVEADAMFNEFPEQNFMELLKNESFDFEEISNLQYAAWGLLKGNEKEISLKEIVKIVEENSKVEEDEFYY